jgi:glycosyltransferase involved in cell wall biosynthesis
MTLVSVILPNYNHAPYLRERIESILNQTYKNIELIILDDCSTDNSKIILEGLKDERIKCVLFNESNSGSPFKQWAKGLKEASGDFIWFAESDDWADLRFLETLIPLIEADPEIGLIFCDSRVYQDGQETDLFSRIRNNFTKTNKWSTDYLNDGHKELQVLSSFCSINNASAVIFRAQILEKILPISNRFLFMGDWFIYIQVANKSKIAYKSLPLNNYREHGTNTSKRLETTTQNIIERFVITDYLLRHCTFLNKSKLRSNLFDYTYSDKILQLKKLALFKTLSGINY